MLESGKTREYFLFDSKKSIFNNYKLLRLANKNILLFEVLKERFALVGYKYRLENDEYKIFNLKNYKPSVFWLNENKTNNEFFQLLLDEKYYFENRSLKSDIKIAVKNLFMKG